MRATLPLGLILLAFGCGGNGPPREPVEQVRGTVTHKGRPAAGALLRFYRKGGAPGYAQPSCAVVQEDGSFVLGTYFASDGAPAGDYKVAVTWRNVRVDADGEYHYSGPDKLQGRYADPATTPLTATIRKGPNDLPPINLE